MMMGLFLVCPPVDGPFTSTRNVYMYVFTLHHDLTMHQVLHSDPTPSFSSTSSYTYSTPETWDTPPPSPTVVSEFPDIVPAHPLDILPCVAPKPFSLRSLMRPWPYDMHRFVPFHLYCIDTEDRKLHLMAYAHMTHAHSLEHKTFCFECVCPTYYPYGNNRRAK
jgi:hypothetical protein